MTSLYARILFVVALGVAVGAVVWTYMNAIQKAERLEAEMATMSTALQEQANAYAVLQTKFEFTDKLLKEKQDDEAVVRRALYQFGRKLESLRSNDPVVRDWASTPIPDPVVGLLRGDGAGGDKDGVRVPAGRVDSPDAP